MAQSKPSNRKASDRDGTPAGAPAADAADSSAAPEAGAAAPSAGGADAAPAPGGAPDTAGAGQPAPAGRDQAAPASPFSAKGANAVQAELVERVLGARPEPMTPADLRAALGVAPNRVLALSLDRRAVVTVDGRKLTLPA